MAKHITRRQFLVRTARTTGGVILGSSLLEVAFAQGGPRQVWRHGLNVADVRTLDPALGSVFGEIITERVIGDGLVRYMPGRYNDFDSIEPDLAESWTVSDDGLTYTFALRRGVQFHRGYGELTSEDVVFHFQRIMDPDLASPYRNQFPLADIRAPDPYTVEIVLAEPDPFFLMFLVGSRAGNIVSKAAVEDLGDNFGLNPVGTGPFVVEEYRAREGIFLTRNEEYFRGSPTLERLELLFMPDLSSRTIALKAGDVHSITGEIDRAWVDDIVANGLEVDPQLTPGYGWYLFLNMTKQPFDDLRVRQALAHAINKDEVVAFLGEALAQPLNSPVPPNYFGHTEEGVEQYEYDPDRSRELLAEAGLADGFSMEVNVSENVLYLTPFQILQEQFRRVGIEMEIKLVDHSTYHQLIRQDANPVVGYTVSRQPVASVVLEQWYSSAAIIGKPTAITNFSHYGDLLAPGIDELLNAANQTDDLEEKRRLFEDAQRQISRDLPAIPVVQFGYPMARQPYAEPGYRPLTALDDAGYDWNIESRIESP